MTDEELKNNEQTTNFLLENGYEVKYPSRFIRENGHRNLKEVVGNLNSLQKSINEGVNVEAFGKDMAVSLDKIEEIINSNPYFNKSTEQVEFEKLLNNLRDISTKFYKNTLKAEEVLKNREENLKDIERRIFKLDHDKTIDGMTRSTESVKLSYGFERAQEDYKEALKFYNEQKALSGTPLIGDGLVKFKNELLAAVNALDDASRKLPMELDKMDDLATNIREARDKIVVFGIESQKKQVEYDRLSDKYGLAKTNKKELIHETTSTESLDETSTLDSSKNPKEKETITTIENLISELKKLNPGLEVIKDGDKDGILTEDPSKLVLPEGFKYTEGLGINNKQNDFTPYINAFVKTKEKNLETAQEPEKVENTINAAEESRVPSGKLHYKRTRRAIVAPYIKAVLLYGSLGGIIGLASSALLPATLTFTSLGLLQQKIYNKLVDCGAIKLENFKYGDQDAELPVASPFFVENGSIPLIAETIKSSAKKMLNLIRKTKIRKKTQSEQQVNDMSSVEERPVENVEAFEKAQEARAASIEAAQNDDKKTALEEAFKASLAANLENAVESLEEPSMGGR